MFQLFPEPLLEVSVTLSPAQRETGPEGEMDGVAGAGKTVTTTGIATAGSG